MIILRLKRKHVLQLDGFQHPPDQCNEGRHSERFGEVVEKAGIFPRLYPLAMLRR
ncbi:MAG: hypothetical protein H7834_12040 [Magnetococcus sp. YQC-9]